MNVSEVRVAVCHRGYCVDDRDAFAEDFCEPHGGVGSGGGNNGRRVCSNMDDYLGCLQCRHDATEACWAGACDGEVAALQTCIDNDVVGLPLNAAYYGWIFTNADENDEACWEEGWAYRDCVNANCPAIAACDPKEPFDRTPLVHHSCPYYQG